MPKMPKLIGTADRLREYEEVAQGLGFKPVELLCAQILDFFVQEGIPCYSYKAVGAWLSIQKLRAGATHWCWRPLREKDVASFHWGHHPHFRWHDGFYCPHTLTDSWFRDGARACHPYERLVPKAALDMVAKIEAKFGDDVKFFVSDFAVIVPDPFIMVRPARRGDRGFHHEIFVFGVWWERGFGCEKNEKRRPQVVLSSSRAKK